MTEYKKSKKADFTFIKDFSKIKVSNISDRLKISRSNVLKGTSSINIYTIIRKQIEIEYYKCYIKSLEVEVEELLKYEQSKKSSKIQS